MSYCAYDPVGSRYLADVASLGGWMDFRAWAATQSEPIVNFIEHGSTADPKALATALHAVRADNTDVDDVRRQLAFAADHATHALVLSDGTEDTL